MRAVLGDQVKDHLLSAILAGDYPPGARIVETRVARELGVSQSPVREALRDLAALGVVEMSAFRGARVRHPSASELLDAFLVRTNLEQLAARLAGARLQGADLDHLERCIDDMERAARAGDPHAEAVADAAFHAGIVELAGNPVLLRAWRTTEPYLRTYISLSAPGGRPPPGDLHRPVLEALRSRDSKRIAAAIERHFETAAATVTQLWSGREAAVVEKLPREPLGSRKGPGASGKRQGGRPANPPAGRRVLP
jgi:DNA-binding GntR family transcriptional regulator